MKLPTTLARLRRIRAQGVVFDGRLAEAIAKAEAELGKHGDCGCDSCAFDQACVGSDCGEWDRDVAKRAVFRKGVIVRRAGVRYRATRVTRIGAEPGRDADWERA